MDKEQLEQWLWQRHDGTLPEADRAELEKLLAQSSEARDLANEIASLARQLDGIPTADPPRVLRERILDSIGDAPAPGPHPARSDRSLHRSFRTSVLRYAALAAALVVAVVGVRLVVVHAPSVLRRTNYAGTMQNPPAAVWTRASSLADGAGRVLVERRAKSVLVQLSLERAGGGRFEISTSAPGSRLFLVDLRGRVGQPQVTASSVRFALRGPGRSLLRASLVPPESRLELQVWLQGKLVLQQRIDPIPVR